MTTVKINQQQKDLYVRKGYWEEKTLLDYWNDSVHCYKTNEYVVDDKGCRFTYQEVDERASRLAHWLVEADVRAGDTVSCQIPVWAEFAIVIVACLKAGAVIHPISLHLNAEDVMESLNFSASKVFLCPTSFREIDYEAQLSSVLRQIPSLQKVILLDNCSERKSDFPVLREILQASPPLSRPVERQGSNNVAVIMDTSGTTGRSKGVMLTHNNILFSEQSFNRALGLTARDIMFMPSPLNHAIGFHHGLISPMLIGAKTVLQQHFEVLSAVHLMKQEQCTYSMGPPTILFDLLGCLENHPLYLPNLKMFLCGGAPVPKGMVERARKQGILLCEVYGSTESVPHVLVPPGKAAEWNGDVSGKPLDGIEVHVVDEHGNDVPSGMVGEEISRGPNVFVGYWKDKEATDRALDQDGWFYSGDLCVMDREGRIRVVGRKKDIIIRGGENLSIDYTNGLLEGCPALTDYAVIGMPDPRLGEKICLYAVPPKDGICPALKDILTYLKRKGVQKRFWPEHLEWIDSIPRTDCGKVKKYLLEADIKKRMGLSPGSAV